MDILPRISALKGFKPDAEAQPAPQSAPTPAAVAASNAAAAATSAAATAQEQVNNALGSIMPAQNRFSTALTICFVIVIIALLILIVYFVYKSDKAAAWLGRKPDPNKVPAPGPGPNDFAQLQQQRQQQSLPPTQAHTATAPPPPPQQPSTGPTAAELEEFLAKQSQVKFADKPNEMTVDEIDKRTQESLAQAMMQSTSKLPEPPTVEVEDEDKNFKAIDQISTKKGEVIKTYHSVQEILDDMYEYKQVLDAATDGKIYRGYIWRFAEN